MAYEHVEPAELPYRYVFEPDELESAASCNAEHGFAVVRSFLDAELVEVMKRDVWRAVDPDRTLKPGEARTCLDFVEHVEDSRRLMRFEPYLRLYRHMLGTDDVVIHRSAAIIRMPGAGPVGWHSDFCFGDGPPRMANEVLNRGEWPNGFWFYLTGCHPTRGGLAVIADSHRPDWPGPEGHRFTAEGRAFEPLDPGRDPFDVPGIVPMFTQPGDLILFAARTYHAAYPNGGVEPRLSGAIGCRPRSSPIDAPWPLSDRARAFVNSAPPWLAPFVDGYVGIDPHWKPQPAGSA